MTLIPSFLWDEDWRETKRRKLNPFPPSVPIWHRSAKHSILILEGIIKKFPERRDYESVDEKSLSKAMSRKTTKEKIQAVMG